MLIIASILLFTSIFLIAYTYVIFPQWMISISGKAFKISKENQFLNKKIAVLIAAYNEEDVIEQKIRTTFLTKYPHANIECWIGTDKCSDKTDKIIKSLQSEFPQLKHIPFTERTGKPQIINQLFEMQKQSFNAELLILTDADTLFDENTIINIIAPFQNAKIGGVQSVFEVYTASEKGVSAQEIKYNQREVKIKQGEGVLGAVIGASGACYAIRSELYMPVPKGFLVDDFFLFLQVLNKGYQTVFANNAIARIEISGDSSIEFKRKIRISVGNFQNLFYFTKFLNPFANKSAFIYWSHKVLRWLTPFFMLTALISNALLFSYDIKFEILLYLQLLGYLTLPLDYLLSKVKIKVDVLRFVSHFILMNIALLFGFFKYLKGNSSGVWNTKNN